MNITIAITIHITSNIREHVTVSRLGSLSRCHRKLINYNGYNNAPHMITTMRLITTVDFTRVLLY